MMEAGPRYLSKKDLLAGETSPSLLTETVDRENCRLLFWLLMLKTGTELRGNEADFREDESRRRAGWHTEEVAMILSRVFVWP